MIGWPSLTVGRADRPAVGGGADQAAAAEIQHQVTGGLVVETHRHAARGAVEGGEVELQIVADVGDGRCAVPRERKRNAARDRRVTGGHGGLRECDGREEGKEHDEIYAIQVIATRAPRTS